MHTLGKQSEPVSSEIPELRPVADTAAANDATVAGVVENFQIGLARSLYNYLQGMRASLGRVNEGYVEHRDVLAGLLLRLRVDLSQLRLGEYQASLNYWAAAGPERDFESEVEQPRPTGARNHGHVWRARMTLVCRGKRLSFIRFARTKVEAYELSARRAAHAAHKWAEGVDRRLTTGYPQFKGLSSRVVSGATEYVPQRQSVRAPGYYPRPVLESLPAPPSPPVRNDGVSSGTDTPPASDRVGSNAGGADGPIVP